MASRKTPVLIIGGGVAGLAAALELARRGLPSLVAEQGPRLGGQAARFCCKALATCARCGACRWGDLLNEAAARPEVGFLSLALPVAARPADSGWEVDLAPLPDPAAGPSDPLAPPLGERTTVRAGAVVLAVGHTPFDPRRKTRFGHGRVAGVVTAGELEEALAQGQVPGQARRVAFIQCVGSRDQSLGRLYCSRVCCGFALRLARLAQYLSPESQVTFFHMDVQGYGRAWEDDLNEMRGQMRFVRAMPGEVQAGESGPRVLYAGPDGAPQAEEFDLVVLSTGLEPPTAAAALSDMFGLARTIDGFLGQEGETVRTGAPGVFVAGAAGGPRSIVESIDHAALAAAAAMLHLMPARREASHA